MTHEKVKAYLALIAEDILIQFYHCNNCNDVLDTVWYAQSIAIKNCTRPVDVIYDTYFSARTQRITQQWDEIGATSVAWCTSLHNKSLVDRTCYGSPTHQKTLMSITD